METGVRSFAARISTIGEGSDEAERGWDGRFAGCAPSDASTDSVARGVLRASASSAGGTPTRIPEAPKGSATSSAVRRASARDELLQHLPLLRTLPIEFRPDRLNELLNPLSVRLSHQPPQIQQEGMESLQLHELPA